MPALADALGAAGLVFIDGHEDASPMEHSTSGEAANMEVALQVTAQASGWWLHIDLDVLDREEFSACGAAGSALGVGGAYGWSLGVCNPDLDPERRAAERIVSFVADVTSRWR